MITDYIGIWRQRLLLLCACWRCNDNNLVVLPLIEGGVEVPGVGEDLVEGGLGHVAVELVVPWRVPVNSESVDTMRARSRDPWFLTAIMISRTYIAGLAIAASITERSPPITLGIPCKLFTPHVSVTFVRVFSFHLV